jgi:uncharacterized membrane protein YesL
MKSFIRATVIGLLFLFICWVLVNGFVHLAKEEWFVDVMGVAGIIVLAYCIGALLYGRGPEQRDQDS